MKWAPKFAIVALIVSCVTVVYWLEWPVTSDELLRAKNMEEFNLMAARVESMGADGIPLLLAVIDDSLETKYSLFSYGKVNSSLRLLRDLAADDVYTMDSVPALIRTIDQQIYIGDTLATTEILQTITGVGFDYDSDFVSSYEVEDEDRRQELISVWRLWYETNSDGVD